MCLNFLSLKRLGYWYRRNELFTVVASITESFLRKTEIITLTQLTRVRDRARFRNKNNETTVQAEQLSEFIQT